MNPWLLLGAGALWVASVTGVYWYGTGVGRDSEIADRAKVEETIRETRKLAMEGAADAIAKIVVRNTTVQGRVETIIRDNPVYRDCVHGADQLRNINEALTGRSGSAGSGGVPGADAAE